MDSATQSNAHVAGQWLVRKTGQGDRFGIGTGPRQRDRRGVASSSSCTGLGGCVGKTSQDTHSTILRFHTSQKLCCPPSNTWFPNSVIARAVHIYDALALSFRTERLQAREPRSHGVEGEREGSIFAMTCTHTQQSCGPSPMTHAPLCLLPWALRFIFALLPSLSPQPNGGRWTPRRPQRQQQPKSRVLALCCPRWWSVRELTRGEEGEGCDGKVAV